MQRPKKNYQKWMGVKTRINNSSKTRKINEGDIVWAAIGENVGVEIDGKGEKYSRPVILLRKHSSRYFTGVPLTFRPHKGSWYFRFKFRDKEQVAILVQTKLVDTARVYSRMGKLSHKDFQ
ncbi:type II toxin-antitoxin system PemK/MazF family toxin [Candidatus Saccharibacteria bacterium]|nr:type II toxin-antitoxin system PemK/MazF family toxin [Candidatus Saccharibacteria bacterium]